MLFIVSVVVFLMMHAIPGGPYEEDKVPLSAAAKANYMAKYGLDKPLVQQYVLYMANALRGDFGVPFQSPTETVTGLIARTWPVSASLGLVALLVAFPLGFLLGVLAAMRQNTWVDYATSTTATLGLTVPNFVVAIWLLLLFAVQIRVLPTGGWGQWYHYIMPVIALALAPMALGHHPARYAVAAFRLAQGLKPWAMAEIFIIGVSVALVKVAGLATISLGPAFWAFVTLVIVTTLKDSLMCELTIWKTLEERA